MPPHGKVSKCVAIAIYVKNCLRYVPPTKVFRFLVRLRTTSRVSFNNNRPLKREIIEKFMGLPTR